MLEKELETTKKVIKQAGEAALSYYRDKTENEIKIKGSKKNQSPVTQADLAAEKVIINGLKEFNYGILSEETLDDVSRFENNRVWVIDPLDGTKDFIQQTGEFSFIVGLVEDGKPVMGVVYQPTEEKIYYAVKGQGAFLETKDGKVSQLRVSGVDNMTKMKMFISRNHLMTHEQKFIDKFEIETITCGSAGVKICRLTEQDADIYVNSSDRTGEWDICAGDIIIQEAGGMITDLDGKEFTYNRDNSINKNGFLVSNGKQHKKILKELNKLKDQNEKNNIIKL